MAGFTILGKAEKGNRYDAIVIGSGITGGIAAKELTEKGLKVLVLERGRMVEHIVRITRPLNKDPWEFPLANMVSLEEKKEYAGTERIFTYSVRMQNTFLVKDTEHPYVQEKPFSWQRGLPAGRTFLIVVQALLSPE
jgi:choline dehydrogenase-like flavoprotein